MKGKLSAVGFLLIASALMFSACTPPPPPLVVIEGSGNVVTQEEAIAGFDNVQVSNSFRVDVRSSDSFSVVIRVDDNLVEHLHVVKERNTLYIGLKEGNTRYIGPNGGWTYSISNATLEAEVTMPELTGLYLLGASRATITGFKSAQMLDVRLFGGSRLQGDIEAGDARFHTSDASQVTLSGSGQDVTIDASWRSYVNLAHFPVTDANVEVRGASTVAVNPRGRLDVRATGGSLVFYLGSPTLGTVSTSDGSSVEPR